MLAGAAAWLPWHRSGAVRRSGFALARAADRAGLVEDAWQRALLVAAFLLPLLAALTFLAVVAGRRRWAGGVTCAAGAIGLASCAVVVRLAGDRQVGPIVAAVAALVAMGCGVRLLQGRKTST